MLIGDTTTAVRFICSGLAWYAVRTDSTDIIARNVQYLKLLTLHGFYRVPGFVLTDLVQLLQHGYDAGFLSDQRSSQQQSVDYTEDLDLSTLAIDSRIALLRNKLLANEKYRVLHMRYEREFLGRLLQLPRFYELIEIVQTSGQREQRISRLLIILAEALQNIFPDNFQLNPIVLRDMVSDVSMDEIADDSQQQLIAEWMERFLDNVAKKVVWGDLIKEQDIFELIHLESLDTEHARLGCRQIIELESALSDLSLTRIQVNEPESEQETRYVDHTYVPSGGVAELTNRGSIENLVASELLYIDENHEGINLFDMRYIEGELLYYMRDEGVLLRKRRILYFILDLDTSLQVKPINYDYQISIWAQALLLRIYTDMARIFENDSLHANFQYIVNANNRTYLEKEAGLLKIMLLDDIQHGRVEFNIAPGTDFDFSEHSNRKPYVIVLSEKQERYWEKRFKQDLPGVQLNLVQLTINPKHTGQSSFYIDPEAITEQSMQNLRQEVIQQLLA